MPPTKGLHFFFFWTDGLKKLNNPAKVTLWTCGAWGRELTYTSASERTGARLWILMDGSGRKGVESEVVWEGFSTQARVGAPLFCGPPPSLHMTNQAKESLWIVCLADADARPHPDLGVPVCSGVGGGGGRSLPSFHVLLILAFFEAERQLIFN